MNPLSIPRFSWHHRCISKIF